MYKISEDIEKDLEKKYPNVPVRNFINSLIQLIIDKTTSDGACSIREFGKFISFATYSTRNKKNVLRFKFKPTPVFNNKIKYDEFLIRNHPVKAKNQFTETNMENCLRKKDIRDSNFIASQEASKIGKEMTFDKLRQNIING